jgi:HAD superfamily hydrolase (TIGR01509 family)
MITTVIFDLDGLLADTERLHCLAYQESLEIHGALLSEADYCDHWVRRGRGIGEWLLMRGLDLDPIQVRAYKAKRYQELLLASLQPMEGAVQLLEKLYRRKKLALASSSYRDAVEGVLEGLQIARYFDAIVSGLDVAEVKPAPDIFLAAAQAVGAAPSECVVLEDAEKGVIAAHRAGMVCIGVPNEHTRDHDFTKAARVCASLHEITIELIDSLAATTSTKADAIDIVAAERTHATRATRD